MQLLMEIMLSILPMMPGEFTSSSGMKATPGFSLTNSYTFSVPNAMPVTPTPGM